MSSEYLYKITFEKGVYYKDFYGERGRLRGGIHRIFFA